jgi:BirA family biotin operon repressor/biotin-[acetyl-CoA-carboxylase] ligase
MPLFQPHVRHFDSLPSTNTEAARLAQGGASEGTTIVSNEQTAGRGRLDRSWISPANAGLYLSVILRPQFAMPRYTLIPLLTALAVHDALLDVLELQVDIKWPNDILIGGRKLCGILTETTETEAGRAVIVGIGVNLTSEAFPTELRRIAVSLEDVIDQAVDRKQLLRAVVSALSRRYAQLDTADGDREIISEWEKYSSYAFGKHVSMSSANELISGVTRGLESDGALRIETGDGTVVTVRAGDVTTLRQS